MKKVFCLAYDSEMKKLFRTFLKISIIPPTGLLTSCFFFTAEKSKEISAAKTKIL